MAAKIGAGGDGTTTGLGDWMGLTSPPSLQRRAFNFPSTRECWSTESRSGMGQWSATSSPIADHRAGDNLISHFPNNSHPQPRRAASTRDEGRQHRFWMGFRITPMSETRSANATVRTASGFYFASEQTQSLVHETNPWTSRSSGVCFGFPEPADHLPCRPRGSPGRRCVPAAPSPADVPQDCHGQGLVDLGEAQRLAA